MAHAATFAITAAPLALDELCINTLRFLAVDMVQKANSGHPGLPMGSASMAYALWDRSLKFNPHDPDWPDRDRFILSAGHGCALLYALLHVTGYDLPLEELKRFRQWGSRTPGHPEYDKTPGVRDGVRSRCSPAGNRFAGSPGPRCLARVRRGVCSRTSTWLRSFIRPAPSASIGGTNIPAGRVSWNNWLPTQWP